MAITLVHDCDIDRRPNPQALNGDFRDCYMDDNAPTSTRDGPEISSGIVVPGGKGSDYELRGLVLYDLTKFIPKDATITAASWRFYVNSTNSTQAQSFQIVRIRRHDWKEDEATWNAYKTGSNWTAGGASDTTSDRDNTIFATLGPLIAAGWYAKTITAFVQDAWNNRSGICTFILERQDGWMTTAGMVHISAKNIGAFPGYEDRPHHLRITYTLADRTFQVLVQ